MNSLAPIGPIYQAGTLSGNPLAMQAGLSVLNRLNDKLFYRLDSISSEICSGIQKYNRNRNKFNSIKNRFNDDSFLY